MVKKTVTYKDYNDVERTETFYFDFSEAEVMDMQTSKFNGFNEYLQSIINEKDPSKIIKTFKELVLSAYGEKSEDGRSFIKEAPDGTKLADRFKQTKAYSDIYMELALDAKAAAEFVNNVFPPNMAETIKKYETRSGNENVVPMMPNA